MKKALIVLLTCSLLLPLLLPLTSCGGKSATEISCEEIIAAYEDAGYSVFHNHDDPFYYDLNEACYIKVTDPDDPENNYMYITRYFTEEDAEAACEEREFHPLLWLFFGYVGSEWRWLHVRQYGDVVVETFEWDMLKPMKELMK